MNQPPSIRDLIRLFNSDDIARYVQIQPLGISLGNGSICPELEAEVLSFSPAKTLYEGHHPLCRSLNGIQTLDGDHRCNGCRLRKDCTGQMRLDILHRSGLLRFLLSQSSLRNFMLFLSTLHDRKIRAKGARITVKVLNRGRWGELKFFLNPKYVPTLPSTEHREDLT